jgi:hypothetical protein
MKKMYAFLLMMVSVAIWAQIPNIEIPNAKGDFKPTNEVNLEKLDIKVKIAGNISTTVMTMVFRSNSNRILKEDSLFRFQKAFL